MRDEVPSALATLRSRLPSGVKRPVRRMVDAWSDWWRLRAFDRCVEELRAAGRYGALTPGLIVRMRRAWGNESYSADTAFLGEVAARLLGDAGPFLDCGSGLSTVLAGVLADQRGSQVWSLEQDDEWYRHVRQALDRYSIRSVTLYHAPLKSRGDYAWYDLSGVAPLPGFCTHVFCDGPAVRPGEWSELETANWRSGVVPVLEEMGIGFGEIILDDAEDRRCQQLRANWDRLGLESSVVTTSNGLYVAAKQRPR